MNRLQELTQEIQTGMARAFFASAWADQCEETGNAQILSGAEILTLIPEDIDPAALHAAQTLVFDLARANAEGFQTADGSPVSVLHLYAWARKHAEGDREPTAENFGHYCAMQSMGHGVGLRDAFGADVADKIRIPYVEFGSHSLQLDYFE